MVLSPSCGEADFDGLDPVSLADSRPKTSNCVRSERVALVSAQIRDMGARLGTNFPAPYLGPLLRDPPIDLNLPELSPMSFMAAAMERPITAHMSYLKVAERLLATQTQKLPPSRSRRAPMVSKVRPQLRTVYQIMAAMSQQVAKFDHNLSQ